MTNYAELWALLVSAFLPLGVGAVANCDWPSWAKELTATLSSLAVGIVSVLVVGGVKLTGVWYVDALLVFLGSFGASKLAYQGWKAAGITSYVLEHVINVSKPVQPE